jgi:hypothetical protein
MNASVSNSAADRAGAVLRRFAQGEDVPNRELIGAYDVASAYRDLHAYPLRKVTMGVRSMVRTSIGEGYSPGQRFKRMDRIIDKLGRYPHMRLSQMEDIGGCRVVVPSLREVYLVSGRIMRRWGSRAQLTDYIREPKTDGYRGIHIIERRDAKQIEVQIRTRRQQVWAEVVESWTQPAVDFSLKDGQGPEEVRRYFERNAQRLALEDAGEGADDTLIDEIAGLYEYVRPYLAPRGVS